MDKFLKKIEESVSETELLIIKESFDKLSEVIDKKDLAIMSSSLIGTIDESVKSSLIEKVQEVSEKSEELLEAKGKELVKEYLEEKLQLEAKVEAHGKSLVEEYNKFKDQLVEEYLEEKEELQSVVLDTLDEYLETQINESIDDTLLDKIALNECLAPVVDGVMKVFAENYVEVGSSEAAIQESSDEKVANLELRLNESIAKNIEQEKVIEEAAKAKMIASKCKGLSESQISKVNVMFAESTFKSVSTKIDAFVELIAESEVVETADDMINSEEEVAAIVESEAALVVEEEETIQALTEDVELAGEADAEVAPVQKAKVANRAASWASKYA